MRRVTSRIALLMEWASLLFLSRLGFKPKLFQFDTTHLEEQSDESDVKFKRFVFSFAINSFLFYYIDGVILLAS